uniref:Putative PUCC protein n=1 Tax=uncultured marine microorganism HF4000_010I05 TaxID=455517 RepID=B3T1M6_9ZZZZ|nr:putative PUCC protein [uncultured marine microorganism HF4000_010I05]
MTLDSAEEHWSNLSLLKLSAFGFGMIGLLLAMDTVILPVLVLEVSPESLKNTYLSVIGLAGLIVAGAVQLFIGRYSDRTQSPLGRRVPFLIWGCGMVCLGLVGIGFAQSLVVLLLVWLFIQANLNVAYGPYQALIRDLVPIHRIGVASSIKILSDGAGSLFLIVVAGRLIERTGGPDFISWKWITLAIIAVVLMSSTVITSITVRARESATELTKRLSGLVKQPAEGLHPQLRRFLLSRLLIITAITAFPTYGLFFLSDSIGVDNPAQSLTNMIPAVGGAFVLAVYPAGWISDRVGRKPVILTGAIGASAGAAWMILANSAGDVMITASLMGASIGILMSSNWALANDLGTSGKEGMHMGIVNLSTTGGAASSKLMGPGIDLLNRISDGRGYDALFITTSTLFILGALLLMPLRVETPSASSASTVTQSPG